MIHYLLAKYENEYHLYSPETFGLATWGNGHYQEDIIYENNKWFFDSWSAGNEWIEDEINQDEIPVVLETTSLKRVIRYLKNHQATVEQIKAIVAESKQIIWDYVAIEEWTKRVGW